MGSTPHSRSSVWRSASPTSPQHSKPVSLSLSDGSQEAVNPTVLGWLFSAPALPATHISLLNSDLNSVCKFFITFLISISCLDQRQNSRWYSGFIPSKETCNGGNNCTLNLNSSLWPQHPEQARSHLKPFWTIVQTVNFLSFQRDQNKENVFLRQILATLNLKFSKTLDL